MTQNFIVAKAVVAILALAPMAGEAHAQLELYGQIFIGEKFERHTEQVRRARIDFRNETNKPIRVVMDSNREVHEIAAGGQATFSEANLGDAPTFRIYEPSSGLELFARSVAMRTTPHSSFGWNGRSF